MLRSVEVVDDLDATEPGSRFRGVGSLLDPLSAPKLTGFRREVRDRHQRGRPRLCCGKCGKPVYVSLAGTGHPDGRDGRDAFFAHHAGTAADCDWGTVGKHPRDIDRKKFGGVAEGALHNRLKRTLAAMLAADRTFSDVQIEEVVSRPPDWRKPDVIATFAALSSPSIFSLRRPKFPRSFTAKGSTKPIIGQHDDWMRRLGGGGDGKSGGAVQSRRLPAEHPSH